MKKTLILMRHAKTEAAQFNQKDFDRQLTERGINDAAVMGQRLADKGLHPDNIVCSTAKRTQQTAKIISEHLNYKNEIEQNEQLYLCSAHTIEDCVLAIDDKINCAMIIAHNPGISEFVFDCNSKIISEAMPTAALAVFSFDAESWKDFTKSKKNIEFYDQPKK